MSQLAHEYLFLVGVLSDIIKDCFLWAYTQVLVALEALVTAKLAAKQQSPTLEGKHLLSDEHSSLSVLLRFKKTDVYSYLFLWSIPMRDPSIILIGI